MAVRYFEATYGGSAFSQNEQYHFLKNIAYSILDEENAEQRPSASTVLQWLSMGDCIMELHTVDPPNKGFYDMQITIPKPMDGTNHYKMYFPKYDKSWIAILDDKMLSIIGQMDGDTPCTQELQDEWDDIMLTTGQYGKKRTIIDERSNPNWMDEYKHNISRMFLRPEDLKKMLL